MRSLGWDEALWIGLLVLVVALIAGIAIWPH
jgi:hypothetical protein